MSYYYDVMNEVVEPGRDWGDWWYGAGTTPSAFYAYLAAYFLADTVVHGQNLDFLIRLHHFIGFVSCFLANASPNFRGLFITISLILELGSLSTNVSDLFLVSPVVLPSCLHVLFLTSIVPFLIVCFGVFVQMPSDPQDWFLVAGALIGSALRIQTQGATTPNTHLHPLTRTLGDTPCTGRAHLACTQAP